MRAYYALLFAFLIAARAVAAGPTPLTSAHAHNDYQHKRPLFEALERGYCSIEADVHLVDGQLLVAHDAKDVKPERTLAALYLDPLRQRVRANGGRVYRNGPPVFLLVDVKTAAAPTYAALNQLLSHYADMLSDFTADTQTTRAVTVLVSGNRDLSQISAEAHRFVIVDGHVDDLDTNPDRQLVPIVSASWDRISKWRGTGEFPAADREKLETLIQHAHAQGRTVRFWATPDRTAMWQLLIDSGVDLIGADDLAGLQKFLLARDAAESKHAAHGSQ
jgi:hypothetical protein